MALEEEIWFSSEEEAQECSRIFRALNISTQIKTKIELESRVQYRAPYKVMKGIIEEEINRIQGEGEQDADEQITLYNEIMNTIQNERDLLQKTFSNISPGEHIGSTVFQFLIRDGKMPETEDKMAGFLEEATLTRILELNNLLDIDNDGIILASTVSPDDAILSVFGDEIPPLSEESLKKWAIIRSLEARDILSYIVTTSPDVVFLENLKELEDFFVRIEYDEDNLLFFANLQVKQVLVAEIISMVQKEGKASKDELIAEFLHRQIPIDDECISIGLHLSPRYIEGVLDDLKKTGILKGKDSKLKVVL